MRPLIHLLSGPNLNLLGLREPEIYGTTTLEQIHADCTSRAEALGLDLVCRQSNHEGQLVEWIQDAFLTKAQGIIINAAAYTHTSVALHDALKMLSAPIIELHISDPKTREAFRHHSYIESLAAAHIVGQGPAGYGLAVDKMAQLLNLK